VGLQEEGRGSREDFFAGLGMPESLHMDWSEVLGAKSLAKLEWADRWYACSARRSIYTMETCAPAPAAPPVTAWQQCEASDAKQCCCCCKQAAAACRGAGARRVACAEPLEGAAAGVGVRRAHLQPWMLQPRVLPLPSFYAWQT
jgi:hypothetical protein